MKVLPKGLIFNGIPHYRPALRINCDWVTNGRWMLRKSELHRSDQKRMESVNAAVAAYGESNIEAIDSEQCERIVEGARSSNVWTVTPWLHDDDDGTTLRAVTEGGHVAWLDNKYLRIVRDLGADLCRAFGAKGAFCLKRDGRDVGALMPCVGPTIDKLPTAQTE